MPRVTNRKEQRVTFRATVPEIELWNDSAEHEGLTLSDWIRTRLNRRDALSVEAETLIKIHNAVERNNVLLTQWLVAQGVEIEP